HGAKGLEAQVVFIIGLTTGFGGFPDVWMGDRVYQLVRPTKYDILMEEERRLFYVAITRAKERLYLITELGAESSFISEIPENYKVQYSPSINLDMKYTVNCESCGVRLEKYFKYCPNCGIET
ncbi:MAG: ATP-dependent helicase, partial [Saprospiraceae bacterium]|nr:ATP-dependent helicase [Saprospiraceae bacterium]